MPITSHTNTPIIMQKNTKDIAAAALATAAGAAVGTASSAAVMQHIDAVHAEAVDDVVTTDADEVQENEAIERAEVVHEAAGQPSAHMAADAELIDANTVDVETVDEDMSIQVLGVEAVDNGMGGMAIVAALESEGETALMVDIDSDGIMDALVYDINGDGVITENEIEDISGAQVYTEDVIDVYQMQELAQQSFDDAPDYMNDADPTYFDA